MPRAESTIAIARSPEQVFDFLAAGENNPLWRPEVLDIERTSGSGVGEVWRQGHKGPLGRRVAADYRITQSDRPKRLAFVVVAGPARPEGLYELEAEGEGTRLRFVLSWEPKGLSRVLSSTVQKTMTAEVAQLQKLKEVVESR